MINSYYQSIKSGLFCEQPTGKEPLGNKYPETPIQSSVKIEKGLVKDYQIRENY